MHIQEDHAKKTLLEWWEYQSSEHPFSVWRPRVQPPMTIITTHTNSRLSNTIVDALGNLVKDKPWWRTKKLILKETSDIGEYPRHTSKTCFGLLL